MTVCKGIENWHALLARAAAPPKTVDLDGTLFTVKAIHTQADQHVWAGQACYEDLSAPYLLATEDPPRRLKLSFASPTMFKQNGMTIPFPLPELVFGSLNHTFRR